MKCYLFFILFLYNSHIYLYTQEVIFNNPKEAVDFAVQNSQVFIFQKQIALLNMKDAKYDIKHFLPTLSFSLAEIDNIALFAGDTRTKSFQANISQEIFDGGRNKFTYGINRLSSMYAYHDYENSLMEFSSQIIQLYYQYLMQKQIIIIKEELLTVAKTQLDIIEREVELGITLETDYLEYLISYIQMENDRDQSKRDLNLMERRFKNTIDLSNEANLLINDNYHYEFHYFYYEPFTNLIWAIIKNNSTEIKKQNLALEYTRKQLAFSRRWFIPILSVQGGISFSGAAYPLTEPKYSIGLTIDFSNADLFPVRFSNSYGLDRNRLYNVNNSASVTLDPIPTYSIQRKLADISVLETNAQRIQTEKDLFEQAYDLIISHDNSLRYADAIERTIAVSERRIEFSRREVEQGEKKRIDYLQDLINLSELRISLLDYQTQSAFLERSLEILAGFPFGDLRGMCE